jgi:hypothetical protein
MKSVAGIAMFVLAGAAWAQNEELTARQIFDFGVKAPTAVKPNPPRTNVGTTKPKVNTPATDPIQVKPPVNNTVSNQDQAVVRPLNSEPDNVTHIQKVGYSPLALRYSILQKKGDNFEEVDADTAFHSGDRIRVKVESNGAAYLYIVLTGSSGQSKVLFPDQAINNGNNRVEAGKSTMIPPESVRPFYFDETAGVEKVSLVLSREREPNMENLIYAAGDPTRKDNGTKPPTTIARNTIDDSALGGVREKLLSRDLVFEKYDGPASDGEKEKAVYAATKDNSPNARLWVDLSLTHK